jgi:hypothetical protein
MKLNSGIDVFVSTNAFDDLVDDKKVEAKVIEFFPGIDYQLAPSEVAIQIKDKYQWRHANCFVVDKDFVKKAES